MPRAPEGLDHYQAIDAFFGEELTLREGRRVKVDQTK